MKDLYRKATFKNISFKLHEGEILGIAGLMGSGRSEIARVIFGVDKPDYGEIWVNNKRVKITSPKKAISLGIGFATEDRKEQGLFLIKSIMFNISFVVRKLISKIGFISGKKDKELAEEYVEKLNIKTPGIKTNTVDLSGGNQQKVILARWLSSKPRILILDEPTRGIDVGAKEEVHKLIRKLAGEGVGILMISSELPEVLSVADRIVVMYEGQISGELDANEATEEKVVQYASGFAELA